MSNETDLSSFASPSDDTQAQQPVPSHPALPPDEPETIEDVLAIERALTTQHLADVPVRQPNFAPPPEPVDVDRIEQVFLRQALAGLGWFARGRRRAARIQAKFAATSVANDRDARALQEAERVQSEQYAYWTALNAHDRDTVIAAVDDALAHSARDATCVDAGLDPESGRYVSCVVTFGHPDLVPARTVATTPTGKPGLLPRSKHDTSNLYVAAMASTVLATVREALAVAPAADELRIVVVRSERPDADQFARNQLSAIYAGVFRRRELEGLDWTSVNAEAELLAADGAELEREGPAQTVAPLQPDTQRRMAAIMQAFSRPEGEERGLG